MILIARWVLFKSTLIKFQVQSEDLLQPHSPKVYRYLHLDQWSERYSRFLLTPSSDDNIFPYCPFSEQVHCALLSCLRILVIILFVASAMCWSNAPSIKVASPVVFVSISPTTANSSKINIKIVGKSSQLSESAIHSALAAAGINTRSNFKSVGTHETANCIFKNKRTFSRQSVNCWRWLRGSIEQVPSSGQNFHKGS